MATQTITPVVQTAAAKPENTAVTYLNNMPDTLQPVDKALHDGYLLQTAFANESDYRVNTLVNMVVAHNKATARANVAAFERDIDAWTKLPMYRKSHTRDAVEAIYTGTDVGKLRKKIRDASATYLENNK